MTANPDHRAVRAVSPVAPYVGGKRQLATRLAGIIDSIPHATYAEAFIGMGGVFLRRRRAPKAEVINDASRDVSNLFRILQRHLPQLLDVLRYQLTSRAEFERLVRVDPVTLTDLERAARFLYLQRTCFGGKVIGRTFGVSLATSARFDLSRLPALLGAVHERLAGVVIESLDFAEMLEVYDSPGTLFYLDPPYFGSEGYYGKDLFGRTDFERLATSLGQLKGKFVLSINDAAEIRAIFAGFEMEQVDLTYTLRGRGESTAAEELIITNVRPFPRPQPHLL